MEKQNIVVCKPSKSFKEEGKSALSNKRSVKIRTGK